MALPRASTLKVCRASPILPSRFWIRDCRRYSTGDFHPERGGFLIVECGSLCCSRATISAGIFPNPIHPSQHLPGERNTFLRSLEYCGLRSSEYADHGFMLRDHLPLRRISPVKEIILVNLLKVISPDLPLAFALSRGWTTKQKLASRLTETCPTKT
ncbi:uncharacterized protein LOC112351399 [Selaginella moellendorffii]|uniref:uncharacterized protein LOC112351399 n=1 Tax=Selaginella moellendorffii TaxID=88036 RepID=UPI000D1C39F9|nr:uncharacterized protein LOC112351399 [Selaginella moellendorffii]|eukprot:XP_024545035.1 uncharacterized protein LOC112351399 [Selaginella moellendorffii]